MHSALDTPRRGMSGPVVFVKALLIVGVGGELAWLEAH